MNTSAKSTYIETHHKNSRPHVHRQLVILLAAILCAVPVLSSEAAAATYYVDAANGDDANPGTSDQPWRTLEKARSLIASGDEVILRDGYYGTLASGKNNTGYVTIRSETGAKAFLRNIVLKGASYWKFVGLTITPESSTPSSVADHGADPSDGWGPWSIVYGYNNDHIWFEDCSIYTVSDASSWDVNDWSNRVWEGLNINSTHQTCRGLMIKNVKTGMKIGRDSIVERCSIDGFIDGIMIGGPNIVVQDNTILNVYFNIGGTHEDAIQGWGVDGSNIYIRRNYINARTDPDRTIDGLQGIFCEYEYADGFTVENNVVLVVSNHGIKIGEHPTDVIRNLRIVNNTVVRCYKSAGSTPAIGFQATEPYDSIVRNNIAHSYDPGIPERNTVVDNNIEIEDYEAAEEFVSFSTGNVHLTSGSSFRDAGSSSNAPAEDIDGKARPVGPAVDVGAYEYGTSEPQAGAPVLDTIGNKEVFEAEQLAFTISATDPDGDTVTYSTSEVLPGGATLSSTTGAFSWTPAYDQAGTYGVTFVASDGTNEDSETITISVWNAGRPPELTSIANQSGSEGVPISLELSASDPDGDALTYSGYNLPDGATLSDQTFAWTPGYTQAGSYDVTFSVSDGALEDSETVTLTIANTNRSPSFASTADQSVEENAALNFTVSASDSDGDPLTYSASGLPSGATFSDASFAWTPGYDQEGSYSVTFTASDGAAQDTQAVGITVANSNRAPVFAPVSDQSVSENAQLSFSVSATDADGDAVTYSAASLPGGASFSNQTFTWTPTYTQAGTYTASFLASDGQDQTTESVTISVSNVNRAPALAAIGDQAFSENTAGGFTLSASDPDNDTLTYSSSTLPTGASLSGSTFTWTPGYTQAGTYSVTFTVSDGQAEDSETITLTVSNTNRAPYFGDTPDRTVSENASLNFSVSATDTDGDSLSYSATNLPAGATFSGRTFDWTPTYAQAGTYSVQFTADDGQDQTSQTVGIVVDNVNRAPVLASIGSQSVDEDSALNFPISATDADGETVTYSALNLPSGAALSGSTFAWTPTYEQAGSYQITFIADDSTDQDSELVTVTVANVNRPPVLDTIGARAVAEDSLLTFSVSASDPDGQQITYSASGLPDGATFADGVFRWTPSYEQAGAYSLTISAGDGSATDVETVALTVENVNRTPVLSAIANQTVAENTALSFSVSASDPDGDDVTVTAGSLPAGATFSAESFAWTPTYEQAGSYELTFTASDGSATDTETVTVTVGNTNRPPELLAIGDKSTDEDTALTFTVTADDPDGDTITYSAQDLPDGAGFSANQFSWTPTYLQEGNHTVTFVASDGQAQDSQAVVISVGNVNRAPVLTEIADQSVSENTQLSFAVSATDPDGDAVSYAASDLPTGAAFAGTTFAWTPTYEQAGVFNVTFSASDGDLTDSQTVAIAVGNANRAPVLGELSDQTVDEETTLSFAVTATDADSDTLDLTASDLPDGAAFANQAFNWTPRPDQADATYDVLFVASDGDLQDTQTVRITVNSVDTTAPVVSRTSPAAEAIQAPLNSLVIMDISDSGAGIDADTVAIQVDDEVVYTGDVDEYASASGLCRRRGTPSRYTYTYQANTMYHFDQTVSVKAAAADLEGNRMAEHTYAFRTEMRSFGNNKKVDSAGLEAAKGAPAAIRSSNGDLWAVWHAGPVGARDIYISRQAAGSQVFGSSVQITSDGSDQCNPSIGLDRNDKLYVVWQDNRAANWDIYVASSNDGVKWSRPSAVVDADDNQTNPVLVFDNGSPNYGYVAWQDDRNGNQDIFLAASRNGFSKSDVTQITANAQDQTSPVLTVDGSDVAYCLWTDHRNSSADIYGACSSSNWANAAVVTASGDQTDPAIAPESTGSMLHLVWVDSSQGDADVYYGSSSGLPTSAISGRSLIDDTTAADQLAPAIAVNGATGNGLKVFVCWQDYRNIAGGVGDTDLYMVQVNSGSETNVLLGDDRTNADQSEPMICLDTAGYPAVLWLDNRSAQTDIYYAGSTYMSSDPLTAVDVEAGQEATIGAEPAEIADTDDVSVQVPTGACPHDATIAVYPVVNPRVISNPCLNSYEIGPSGMEFDVPVTVTIPYTASDDSVTVEPYWYDSLTGDLSQQGISDIETLIISPTVHALRFRTTHFTPFYVIGGGAAAAIGGGGGGGGGCSVSPTGDGSVVEFLTPYFVLTCVMVGLRIRDRRRRSRCA